MKHVLCIVAIVALIAIIGCTVSEVPPGNATYMPVPVESSQEKPWVEHELTEESKELNEYLNIN